MATSTRRRGGKTTKRRSSDAKIAAAKKRDAELTERVDALLNDRDAANRLTAVLGDTPGIMRFSLRNQLLLVTEADSRGMKLTAVATYNQWATAGRQVRNGEHGFTIVRPVGRKGEEVSDDETAADRADRDNDEDQPTKFRGMRVFDVSQTDDMFDDTERVETDEDSGERYVRVDQRWNTTGTIVTEAEAHTARAAQDEQAARGPGRLLESLREAAESNGYTVNTGAASVDTDSKTMTLPAELTPDTIAPVIEVARTLAIGRVRAREARKAAAEDGTTPAGPQRPSVAVSHEGGDVETFSVI